MKHIHIAVSTFFWSGFFPVAPGTFGTLVFVPVYYFGVSRMHPVLYIVFTLAIYLAGVWSSNYASVILKDKDPSNVVIDEVVGFLVTMVFIPVTPARVIIGFFLFRFYDIIKPYPAAKAEHLRGGNGIMLDDVIAGVYANVTLWAVIFLKIDIYSEKFLQPLKLF